MTGALLDEAFAALAPMSARDGCRPEATGTRVLRRDRLGGLIHEYSQVA